MKKSSIIIILAVSVALPALVAIGDQYSLDSANKHVLGICERAEINQKAEAFLSILRQNWLDKI
jgi:hypothetical protein